MQCSNSELGALGLALPRLRALGALGVVTASLPLLELGQRDLPFPFDILTAPEALEDVWGTSAGH